MHDIGGSAMSVPAGIFGTISSNANAAPRLLLGDIVEVYHTAADALADLSAKGELGWLQCASPLRQLCSLITVPHFRTRTQQVKFCKTAALAAQRAWH